MHLNTKDKEHLMLHYVGQVAIDRKERGVKLNYVESVGFICHYIMEQAREGAIVADLMDSARDILKREDVMPGVPEMLEAIQIEATFPDGAKLVTVHDPIN